MQSVDGRSWEIKEGDMESRPEGNDLVDEAPKGDEAPEAEGRRGVMGRLRGALGSGGKSVVGTYDTVTGAKFQKQFNEFTDAVTTTVIGVHQSQEEQLKKLALLEERLNDAMEMRQELQALLERTTSLEERLNDAMGMRQELQALLERTTSLEERLNDAMEMRQELQALSKRMAPVEEQLNDDKEMRLALQATLNKMDSLEKRLNRPWWRWRWF